VMRWVAEHGAPGDDRTLRDLCAAFQQRVVRALVDKALVACQREGLTQLVLAGGVAANRELRETAHTEAAKIGVRVVVPPLRSCTDNAAMIAWAGLEALRHGASPSLEVEVSPRSALARVTRKGRGTRGATA
jgi:N6-L-threonylcarbamoyladenine synthase